MGLKQGDEICLFVLLLERDAALLELCVQLCDFESVAGGEEREGQTGMHGGRGGERGRTSLSWCGMEGRGREREREGRGTGRRSLIRFHQYNIQQAAHPAAPARVASMRFVTGQSQRRPLPRPSPGRRGPARPSKK